MGIYVYADVGRSGLGNGLLPWARAVAFAEHHQVPMLYPPWGQPRLGPYLRGERDKRRYGQLFQPAGYVSGWRKHLIRTTAMSITEGMLFGEDKTMHWAKNSNALVVFRGLGEFFIPLREHHGTIKRRLWEMTRPEWREMSKRVVEPFFAAHVRRGDQVLPNQPESKVLQHVQCTTLEWFVLAVRKLREQREFDDLPVIVFTDGTPQQVGPLLAERNVELAQDACSIVDLWILSRAVLLLASGYSTFSMWASFLGRMPTLYAPGKMQQKLFESGCEIFEGEWTSGDPLPEPNI